MDGKSLTSQQEKINALRRIFPEAFCEGKIDWEKLQATLGENINFANERYVLNWAGKSDTFRVMQQPSTRTLVPVREDSVNFDDTQNIFIEGENLEVLKVLQKSYFGKIKMIYIDPPYNTGNDSFIYPDKFSETKEEYQKRVGDKDEDGYLTGEGMFRRNSRENGHYHSNWLNMMMPRLYLARTLLRDDGVIFVSIDDNEVHNLRLLMNEIFGEENFVGEFIWRKKDGGGQAKEYFVIEHEYILVFRKSEHFIWYDRIENRDISEFNKNDEKGKFKITKLAKWGNTARREDRPSMYFALKAPNGESVFPVAPDGNEGRWRVGKERMQEIIDNDLIYWEKKNNNWLAYEKQYYDNQQKIIKERSILYSVANTGDGSNLLTELFGKKDTFENPKSIKLISVFLSCTTKDESIILDFFAGSATTAHAVMQLNKEDGGNRKYILVQLPELCDEKSEAYKAGYCTIADIAKERIRRAGKKIQDEIKSDINKIKTEIEKLRSGELPAEDTKMQIESLNAQIESLSKQDLGFKTFRLNESNFKQWKQPENYSAEALAEQLKLFIDPVAENADLQNMVYELLLKNGKDLNAEIENHNGYYLIDGNDLALILEQVNEQIIAEVLAKQPKKVIALDRIFKNNDQLKTNTALQMKDAGAEFKTI